MFACFPSQGKEVVLESGDPLKIEIITTAGIRPNTEFLEGSGVIVKGKVNVLKCKLRGTPLYTEKYNMIINLSFCQSRYLCAFYKY